MTLPSHPGRSVCLSLAPQPACQRPGLPDEPAWSPAAGRIAGPSERVRVSGLRPRSTLWWQPGSPRLRQKAEVTLPPTLTCRGDFARGCVQPQRRRGTF